MQGHENQVFSIFEFKNKQKKVELGPQTPFEPFRHFVDHVFEIYSKCYRIPSKSKLVEWSPKKSEIPNF